MLGVTEMSTPENARGAGTPDQCALGNRHEPPETDDLGPDDEQDEEFERHTPRRGGARMSMCQYGSANRELD
jgi:hypothetical protein